VALGYNASSGNQYSVALGPNATTANNYEIALGTASNNVKVRGTLEANGDVIITKGKGNGKVLTSDVNGLASWQTPAAGGITQEADTLATVLARGNISSSDETIANLTLTGNITMPAQFFIGAGDHGTLTANSILIGNAAKTQSSGNTNIAIGNSSSAGGLSNSLAIGSSAKTIMDNAVAIGSYARGGGTTSIAIGNLAGASDESCVAIGYGANAKGAAASIAIGKSAIANTDYCIAIGDFASAGHNAVGAIAIGYAADAGGGTFPGNEQAIAIGNNVKANGIRAIAIGEGASTLNNYAVAIGNRATAESDYEIALGTAINTVKVRGTLEANSDVKITKGKGAGLVLTSDGNGLATWQTPAAGGLTKEADTLATVLARGNVSSSDETVGRLTANGSGSTNRFGVIGNANKSGGMFNCTGVQGRADGNSAEDGYNIGVEGIATGESVNVAYYAFKGTVKNKNAMEFGSSIGMDIDAQGATGVNVYGFKASATGGTNNWGTYITADKNYFSGRVGIATSDPGTNKLKVAGTAEVTGDLIVGQGITLGTVNKTAWPSGGLTQEADTLETVLARGTNAVTRDAFVANIGIGTTEAVNSKLDVNGNIRIRGTVTALPDVSTPAVGATYRGVMYMLKGEVTGTDPDRLYMCMMKSDQTNYQWVLIARGD
jgi:hypothetical protein